MAKSVGQILQEARRRIETGWTQGAAVRRGEGEDHFCALGALTYQMERWDWENTTLAAKALIDAVPAGSWRARLVRGSLILQLYNDQPGRTKEEILALYDRALREVTK